MNLEMAREWLRSASDDLVTIKEIIHNDSLTQVVAFHSQQCVEKSIKAVIFYDFAKRIYRMIEGMIDSGEV